MRARRWEIKGGGWRRVVLIGLAISKGSLPLRPPLTRIVRYAVSRSRRVIGA